MKRLRGTIVGAASSIVCIGLLFSVYPWSKYFGDFNFSAGVTISSYLILAALVGITAGVVVTILSSATRLRASVRASITAALLLALLFIGSLLLGPLGVEIVHTRVNGIFFAEWKFITFDMYVALPISILDAALVWYALHLENKRNTSHRILP